ncbi:hypothetical protein MVEN_01727800 [Mycena venus]|uniref:Uncharacterized protein n=1 Tax=Mycena venus TaxID=2733690 RepID=A0A8H6XL21_9AGAR|nr:hypothetical protein MVEN_01727800 [Mycena venus]
MPTPIAYAHCFEHPTFVNWLDSRHTLTHSLAACRRSYFALSWMLKGLSHAASLVLLANDLFFEHPSLTFSAQMRTRISSQVRLRTWAAHPDREYLERETAPTAVLSVHPVSPSASATSTLHPSLLPPRGSVVYDMHQTTSTTHRPSAVARHGTQCSHRLGSHSPPPLCAPRLRPHRARVASPQVCHAHTLDTRPRAQQALSFSDTRATLVDPTSRGTLLSVLGVALRAPRLGCATPLPCAATAASVPHRIHRFPRSPPTTTISGTAPLSPSRAAPATIRTTTRVRALTAAILHRGCRVLLRPAQRPSVLRPSGSLVYHSRRSTPTLPKPCLCALEATCGSTGMHSARHHRYESKAVSLPLLDSRLDRAPGALQGVSLVSAALPAAKWSRAAFFEASCSPCVLIGKRSTCDS